MTTTDLNTQAGILIERGFAPDLACHRVASDNGLKFLRCHSQDRDLYRDRDGSTLWLNTGPAAIHDGVFFE